LSRLLPAGQPQKWDTAFDGLAWIELMLENCPSQAHLMRCAPGFVAPHHIHPGSEITLILDGALEDDMRRYVRGNLLIMSSDSTHNPVADRDAGCLCFVVTTQPIRFT
jgi:predicted ChrR family anti-sigma factor